MKFLEPFKVKVKIGYGNYLHGAHKDKLKDNVCGTNNVITLFLV